MSSNFLESIVDQILTSGNAITASTLTATNFTPNRTLKTNSNKELYTTNLEISDTNGLQTILDSAITNPYVGTIEATEFKSSSINSLSTAIGTNITNIGTNTTQIELAQSELSTGFSIAPVMTINGGDNTKFDMSSGAIVIVDNTVSPSTATTITIPAQTAVTPTYIGSQTASYISINGSGNIVQKTTVLTPTQRRTLATLGVIGHINLTNIDQITLQPQIHRNTLSQLHDLIQALGFFNISGNSISLNANLTLNKSAGIGFGLNESASSTPTDPHRITLPVLSIASMTQVTQNLSTIIQSATIDPTSYDLNGTLTTLSNNNYASIHRIYLLPNNQLVFAWGQQFYTTFSNAQQAEGTEPFVVIPGGENALLLGRLVAKKNCTDLTDDSECVFYPVSSASSNGLNISNLQQAYDVSNVTQILTSTVQGAFTIARGSNLDIDDVFVIRNGIGTKTLQATGDGILTTSYTIQSDLPRIKLLKNIVQSIGSFVTAVPIWNTQDFNIGFGSFTAGDNSITVSTSGTYMAGFEVTTNLAVNTGFMGYILLNSTSSGSTIRRYGQSQGILRVSGSTMLNLTSGDVLRVGIRNFSSGSYNFPESTNASVQMEFWCYKVG
jgi:hypothetical protein